MCGVALLLRQTTQCSSFSFHRDADQRIRGDIRHESFVEADRVVSANNRNGVSGADENPNLAYSFVRGWKRYQGKERPEACHQKTCTGPDSDSGFHIAAPKRRKRQWPKHTTRVPFVCLC